MPKRAGFTLIETVFAIFIFSIGALGFAATTAVIIHSLGVAAARERSARVASARERSARVASARLETLRTVPCGAHSGTETIQGIESAWTITPGSSGVSVAERVTYVAAGVPRTDTYTATIPCPR